MTAAPFRRTHRRTLTPHDTLAFCRVNTAAAPAVALTKDEHHARQLKAFRFPASAKPAVVTAVALRQGRRRGSCLQELPRVVAMGNIGLVCV